MGAYGRKSSSTELDIREEKRLQKNLKEAKLPAGK